MKIIIMAQGQQTRLAGHLYIPKQWIELAHGEYKERIIVRTLRLIGELAPSAEAWVVATPELAHLMAPASIAYQVYGAGIFSTWMLGPGRRMVVLERPGNSVITGIRQIAPWFSLVDHDDPVVILLGDVVYSQRTLRSLLGKEESPVTFCGSGIPLPSPSQGEIWGVRTTGEGARYLFGLCLDRVKDVPAPDTYQCGQLRQLLWEYQVSRCGNPPIASLAQRARQQVTSTEWFIATRDWTTDIDTPGDLQKVPGLAAHCCYEKDKL